MSPTIKLPIRIGNASTFELVAEARGHGPLLVVIQAGAAGREGAAAIAPHLEAHFTIVTYDRRGLAGSPLPPRTAPTTLADHADDVARIIAHLDPGSAGAFVFGVSIGAIIGLELVHRHPARVARLVAHEPPLLALLDEPRRTELRARHADVERVFAAHGLDAALAAAGDLGQIDPADREPDVTPADPSPDLVRNLHFFLENDAPAMRRYELPLAELDASRVVITAGASGRDRWVRTIAQTLAAHLGQPLVELPGGHTAYQLRPRAVAAALAKLFV